jgi:AAA+ ATPase superfamily predicted ATPase
VKDASPFDYGELAFKSFINRENEKDRLIKNSLGGISTILISPRRWGKTSLVNKVCTELEKKHASELIICQLDLFSINSEAEFYQRYSEELIEASSSKLEEWLKMAGELLGGLSPNISVDIAEISSLKIGFNHKKLTQSSAEILDLPQRIAEKKGKRVIVCLDEFQNIESFEHSLAFQKKLRAHFQRHNQVSYILYGSKKHMMTELFADKSRPFYRFGDVMWLQKIEEKYWLPFLKRSFEKYQKEIPSSISKQLVKDMQEHPYYIQHLANYVFLLSREKVTEEIYQEALTQLINTHDLFFQRETEGLTANQLNVLKAIAHGHRSGLTTTEVMEEYRLGSSAAATAAINALINKELILKHEKEYLLLDPVMELWIKKRLQ